MVRKLFTALYADENIPYFNEDSVDAIFNYNEMGMVKIDLNIILDNNFEEEDPNLLYFNGDKYFNEFYYTPF